MSNQCSKPDASSMLLLLICAFADLLLAACVQSRIDWTLLHRLPTSLLARSLLLFREKDIPLVAKDNLPLCQIDRTEDL